MDMYVLWISKNNVYVLWNNPVDANLNGIVFLRLIRFLSTQYAGQTHEVFWIKTMKYKTWNQWRLAASGFRVKSTQQNKPKKKMFQSFE